MTWSMAEQFCVKLGPGQMMRGVLTERLLLAVPTLGARMDKSQKAALLAVVSGPQLEVRGLCLGVPPGM